jgi:hypothetical protein
MLRWQRNFYPRSLFSNAAASPTPSMACRWAAGPARSDPGVLLYLVMERGMDPAAGAGHVLVVAGAG